MLFNLVETIPEKNINFSLGSNDFWESLIKQSANNHDGVWITLIICIAIILLAFIAMVTILTWKSKNANMGAHLKEDLNYRQNEGSRKLQAELISKYLDFLKSRIETKEYISLQKYNEQKKNFTKRLLDILDSHICSNGTSTEIRNDLIGPENDLSTSEKWSEKELYIKIIGEIFDFWGNEKPETTNCNPEGVQEYKITLEYLVQLSQQKDLSGFSIENLKKMLTEYSDCK